MTPPTSRSAGSASTRGAASLRIAVVGDLHDYSLSIRPWELLGKPLAGQLNLWLNRRKKFDRALIAPTVARVVECQPDVVLFTGDLTTTSRPSEFRSVAARLAPLEEFECVMVAGNHDRYTFASQRSRRIERTFPGIAAEVFPFARPLLDGWRLVAVDSAVPRLLDSRGRIGPRQLQHVQSLLNSVGDDEGVIVLCHYPFGKPPQLSPMKNGHRLIDERQWRDTIATCRGRVVLVHGHVHCPWVWRPELTSMGTPQTHDGETVARVLDINAGSPTMTSGGWPRGQGFWTIDLQGDPSQPLSLAHHVMGDGEPPVGASDEQSSIAIAPANSDWRERSFIQAL